MTKEDFLKYARTSSANSRSAYQSERPEINYTSIDVGDETTRYDVQRADEGYDGSIRESGGESEELRYTGSGAFRGEQRSDRTVQFSDGSGDGTVDEYGGYDLPIRNISPDTSQPYQSVQSGTTRVTKKRTTLFDKAGKMFGNKLPEKAKKQVVTTTIRKLLTIAEVSKNREKLIHLLLVSSEHMDHGISAITKGHREVEIWSSLERVDCEILVDAYLSAGQKSERIAGMVRKTIEYSEKAQLGIILVPRVYRSIVYMITTGLDIRLI